jgi:hypothetical protein
VVLAIVAGVPQVPPGRAAPSPTARLATGPGPYALLTMLALMGAAMRGPPDAQNWRYGFVWLEVRAYLQGRVDLFHSDDAGE